MHEVAACPVKVKSSVLPGRTMVGMEVGEGGWGGEGVLGSGRWMRRRGEEGWGRLRLKEEPV